MSNEIENSVESFEGANTEQVSDRFDALMDVPVRLTLEVGGTTIPVKNLLQLSQGSLVELDRVAGEALDVKVNGKLMAHGEVVVINEKFGIRLTDIISSDERIRGLDK